MSNLFIYFLQVSIALVVFYLLYWLLLRNETHYNVNRVYLVCVAMLSVILPLFPLHYTVILEEGINQSGILTEFKSTIAGIPPYSGDLFEENISLNYNTALFLIYITGSIFFLARLLYQSGILLFLILKNKAKTIQGLQIVENEKYGLPFSFFNFVFINPKFHLQTDLPEILAHEKVHIREKHWVDLILIELLTVIFWFNPLIWFFEHSIKLNHEFLADRSVISKGTHLGKYQALLVNQIMGMQIIGFTNNLNYSINNNRFKMMTKQKTSKIKALKLVLIMPAIGFLLLAFAEPIYQISTEKNAISTIDIANPTQQKLISGKMIDDKGVALPGVSIIVKGSSKGTVSDLDGTFKIELAEESNLIFSYVGKQTLNYSVAELLKRSSGKTILEIEMKETAILITPEMLLISEPPPPPPPAKTKNTDPPAPKKEIFVVVEEMPSYPGGYQALGEYINQMQQKLAQSKNIKGKAKVSFVIDKTGKATDVRILEQENDLAGKGAATIVLNMKTWNPAYQRGKSVPVNFVLPVEFK
ncbi:MAG: carboxypeptidase-like regulatory domain-containing protein [Bacteroidales bacterium]|nr:carboxypeptidase-like regulatory domain-containing protein [Bacteroidales bacterium]